MTPFPLWSHKVKICGKDFNIKYRKEIPFEKCMPYGRKQTEINDAGVSRVGVRMGDVFFSKYNPIVTTRPFPIAKQSFFNEDIYQ